MTEIHNGPGDTTGDSVTAAVNEEIRQEILRQLESIDCDDDDWRIEALPTFDGQRSVVDDSSYHSN